MTTTGICRFNGSEQKPALPNVGKEGIASGCKEAVQHVAEVEGLKVAVGCWCFHFISSDDYGSMAFEFLPMALSRCFSNHEE